ncbi:MAG: hypothetical protein C4308_15180 [Chitinophagaceae bacterium]
MQKDKDKKTVEALKRPTHTGSSASGWLKVSTPLTIDGVRLAYDEKNQPIFQITFLPLSAKREFERNNSKLPQHLQAQIEEISESDKQALEKETLHDYETKQEGGTV